MKNNKFTSERNDDNRGGNRGGNQGDGMGRGSKGDDDSSQGSNR